MMAIMGHKTFCIFTVYNVMLCGTMSCLQDSHSVLPLAYMLYSLTPQGLVLQTGHRATQHHIPTQIKLQIYSSTV